MLAFFPRQLNQPIVWVTDIEFSQQLWISNIFSQRKNLIKPNASQGQGNLQKVGILIFLFIIRKELVKSSKWFHHLLFQKPFLV